MDLIPISAIEEALRVIAGKAIRTPLVRLNFRDTPAEIYLKLENLQPIGSFKLRGATNAMALVPRERLARGVYTASAGNMAQGVAWNARRLGIPHGLPALAGRVPAEAVAAPVVESATDRQPLGVMRKPLLPGRAGSRRRSTWRS